QPLFWRSPPMKSFKFAISLAILFALVLTACGGNSKEASNANGKKVVKVALTNAPFPQFNNIDASGKQTGYTLDYLALLEERLPEYKFEYEAVDATAMLIGTETGKYDMAATVMFKNA